MQTISEKEFKKKYGYLPSELQTQPGYLKRTAEKTKEMFMGGLETSKEGFKQAQEPGIMNKVIGGLKVPAGLGRAITSPIAAVAEPVVEPTIGKGMKYTAEKISDIPAVQRFATSEFGKKVDPYLEAASLTGELAGYATMGIKTPKVPKGISTTGGRIATTAEKAVEGLRKTTGATGERVISQFPKAAGMARELGQGIPSAAKAAIQPLKRENIINSQIAKAFNLAPVEDVAAFKNVAKMDIGEYMVKNNLLKGGIEETKQALKSFNETNYTNVRSEIGKVKTRYTQDSIPRYNQAINTMLADIKKTPGLEAKSAELNSLLKKKNPSLSDVQRVKELIDDTYSIYKRSGEPSATLKAQGLDAMRKDIREFIEIEVKNNTGADIRTMNRDVAATRELMDAIERRAGKEYTRTGVVSNTGYGLGGFAVGGVPGMVGGLVLNYIIKNPEMRIRFANVLSKYEPQVRQNIINQLKQNKITPEIEKAVAEVQKSTPGLIEKVKKAYKDSPMSDEGGFMRYQSPKRLQAKQEWDKLQARKVAYLDKGYKETSPVVKNIIRSMKMLEKEMQ